MKGELLTLACALLVYTPWASGETGQLRTNGIPEIVARALPHTIRLSPPQGGLLQRRGHLGQVPHYFIGLLDERRGPRFKIQADLLLILVASDYTYPDAATQSEYEKYFLARTSQFQAFFLIPDAESPDWNELKASLKGALEEQAFANEPASK